MVKQQSIFAECLLAYGKAGNGGKIEIKNRDPNCYETS